MGSRHNFYLFAIVTIAMNKLRREYNQIAAVNSFGQAAIIGAAATIIPFLRVPETIAKWSGPVGYGVGLVHGASGLSGAGATPYSEFRGGSMTTQFFDHGSHIQSVTELLDKDGKSFGRSINEFCE